MKSERQAARGLFVLFLATLSLPAADTDYKIDRALMSALAEDADATAPFFVVFGERPSLAPAYAIADRAARARFVVQALQAAADRSQAGVKGYLQGRRVPFISFWIENRIFVQQGTLELARALARRPEVVAVLPEIVYQIPQPQASISSTVEWNVARIRADQVWPATKGAGTVVASIDTGVQYDHPALVKQYRGNTGSSFIHTGNWYDPTGVCGSVPCDNAQHGTHTMGTMVGDDGLGNQIGVAPGAQWIACKGCATNSCFSSHLIACAQWILSPSGASPPHIVNNSWGGGGGNSWYDTYVQNWVAAGVFPAFSAGNSGPTCGTASSPGDYPESFASGATDSSDAIANFSARGPSAFGGIKPNISAPGVSIRSSVPVNSYATFSGTSMASPHIAATVALVWAAAASYAGNIGGTEQVLGDTAVIRTTSESCGGVPAGATPNNTYGAGRIDALAAVSKATGVQPNQPPVVSITSPANGASYDCPVTVVFSGTATDPEDGDLSASIAWADNGTAFGTGSSASKSYLCTEAGNHNIVARVTDSGGASGSDAVTIAIVNPTVPAAPSNLTASVNGRTVTLNWQDNSANESGFRVERKPNGGSWSALAATGPNVTTYSDSPGKGNWQYRVSAFNAAGSSAPSNLVSVRVK